MQLRTPRFNTILYTILLLLAGAIIYAAWGVYQNEKRIENLEQIITLFHKELPSLP